MKYTTLGRTGLQVSKLGIGTNALSRKYDPDVSGRMYNWLLDQGVNYIGTGNMYGDAQTYLRKTVMQRRNDFYLSSKGGILPAKDILKGIEAALHWLGTDHFDVWEIDFVTDIKQYDIAFGAGGTLEGIKQAQEQGKVRFIGVTSHCPQYVNAFIQTGEIDTAMLWVNPVFPYGVREIIPYAKAWNVGTIAMRPTDHGSINPLERALLWSMHAGTDLILSGMYTMAEAEQNLAVANMEPSEEELSTLRAEFSQVPEHNCHSCFRCHCPFHIPVQRFATYFEWRKAYGLRGEVEEELVKQARRAKDFVSFCDTCHLCDDQCPYDVPLSDYVKRAVKEMA